MKGKIIAKGVPSLVVLQYFTVFPEYFVGVSSIYILIVATLITYNVYGLMLQKALSECVSLIMLMTCYLIINDDLITTNFLSFNTAIVSDYFAFFTKLTVCFFSAIYFLVISDSLKEQRLTSFEYLLVILLAVLGLMLMCSSNDLLTGYLAIELSSLAFYIMSSFKKTSVYSVEAGIKYFITGAVSSSFFLLGCSLVYGLTGSICFADYYDLFSRGVLDYAWRLYDWTDADVVPFIYFMWYEENIMPSLMTFDNSFIEVGLSFILFSMFIKLALAPFHLWSLDVYEGSPTSSVTFFAVVAKLSLFVLLIRICYSCFITFNDCWQYYATWVGFISVFVGSFGGLRQRKLKTLLAYSSTSHMGYAMLAFGTGTCLGIQMLLFYIIIYMISGLCLWTIMLATRVYRKRYKNKYSKELGDLALLRKSNPSLAFATALTMFSIAGVPPMAGFLAKMGIFLAIIARTMYIIAFFSILFSVVSTFYYIRVVKVMYFENLLVGKLYYPENSVKALVISALVFLLVFIFVNPTLLYLYCYKVVLTLLI